jgi:hypothetical protein
MEIQGLFTSVAIQVMEAASFPISRDPLFILFLIWKGKTQVCVPYASFFSYLIWKSCKI